MSASTKRDCKCTSLFFKIREQHNNKLIQDANQLDQNENNYQLGLNFIPLYFLNFFTCGKVQFVRAKSEIRAAPTCESSNSIPPSSRELSLSHSLSA